MNARNDGSAVFVPEWVTSTRVSSMQITWPQQTYTDEHQVLTPQLQLMHMSGKEVYGQPYEYKVLAYLDASHNANDPFLSTTQMNGLLKSSVCIVVNTNRIEKPFRYFHGMVTHVKMKGLLGTTRRCVFELTLKPKLSLLKLTRHYRIFHKVSAIDLVKSILKNHTALNIQFEDKIDKIMQNNDGTTKDNASDGHYDSLIRHMVVQYGESDFDFIHRLMKSEGLTYYFDHGYADHTLVLKREENSSSIMHADFDIQFGLPDVNQNGQHPRLWDYEVDHGNITSSFNDSFYDWRTPTTSKNHANYSDPSNPRSDSHSSWSSKYYYQSGNLQINASHPMIEDKDNKTKKPDLTEDTFQHIWDGYEVTRESYVCEFNHSNQYHASTNHREAACGKIFHLNAHPNQAENNKFRIVETQIEVGSEDYPISQSHEHTHSHTPDQIFHSKIRFIPIDWTYYTEQAPPQPKIHGYQSAEVTARGKITNPFQKSFTDVTPHLEVMIKFHWSDTNQAIKVKDTVNNPEQLSQPVRVAQFWAGKNRGAMFIPRVGDEVIVAFRNGDPDQPIIIGSVYNTTNNPWCNPKVYPEVSGITSRVMAENSNNNIKHSQFIMDDKPSFGSTDSDQSSIDANKTISEHEKEKRKSALQRKTTGIQLRCINFPIPSSPIALNNKHDDSSLIGSDAAGLAIFGKDKEETDLIVSLNSGKDVYTVYSGNQDKSLNPFVDIKSITKKKIYNQVGPFTTSKWTYYENAHLSILAKLKAYGMTSIATVGTTMSLNPFGIAMSSPFGTIDMKSGMHGTIQDKTLAAAELAGWITTMTEGFHKEFTDLSVLSFLGKAMGGLGGIGGGVALINFIKKKREKLEDPMTGKLDSRSRIQIKSNAIESSCSHKEKKGSYQLLTSQLATTTTYKGNAAGRVNLAATDILHATGSYDHKTKKITQLSSMYMDSKLYDLVIAKGQDKEETGFFFDKENQYIYSKFTERSMGMGAFSMGFKSPSGYLLLTKKGILMTAKVNDRTSKLMLGGGVAGMKANYSNICLGIGGIHLNTKANISISGQEVTANPAGEAALIAQIGEMMNATSTKVKEATKAFEVKKNLEEKESAYPQFWVDYQKSLQVTTPDEVLTEENLVTNPKAMLKAAFKSMKNPFSPLAEDEVN